MAFMPVTNENMPPSDYNDSSFVVDDTEGEEVDDIEDMSIISTSSLNTKDLMEGGEESCFNIELFSDSGYDTVVDSENTFNGGCRESRMNINRSSSEILFNIGVGGVDGVKRAFGNVLIPVHQSCVIGPKASLQSQNSLTTTSSISTSSSSVNVNVYERDRERRLGLAKQKQLNQIKSNARNIPVRKNAGNHNHVRSEKEETASTSSSDLLFRNIFNERKATHCIDSAEYNMDIIKYWLKFEKRIRPDRKYMSKQKDITHRMRTILVDWIVEVGLEYEMQHETLFIAVNLIDRFLSKMAVARGKLQLVGTAALFVSAKYEEVLPPDVADFVYITDHTYTKEQIIKMEAILLQALEYDLTVPTIYDFVFAFCTILQLDAKVTCLAIYFAELSLLDGERYLHYNPSLIAASSIALARYTFQGLFWDETLSELSDTRQADVQKCSQHLFNSFYEAPTRSQTATYEKYKSIRYYSIAHTLLPAKLPWIS